MAAPVVPPLAQRRSSTWISPPFAALERSISSSQSRRARCMTMRPKPTAIRVNDMVNSTGVAAPNKTLDYRCARALKADRIRRPGLLWTVDTSARGPYQAALGNTANAFVNRLKSAGVDMRVGVVTAGYQPIDFTTPGFKFINGTSATPALDLCRQVTSNNPESARNSLAMMQPRRDEPYAMKGGWGRWGWHGIMAWRGAGGVVLHDQFKRNAAMGNTNVDQTFRAGATKVVERVSFAVTDEPGSNDHTVASRYFRPRATPTRAHRHSERPTTRRRWRCNIVNYFLQGPTTCCCLLHVPVNTTRTEIFSTTLNVADLPRCVIETSGGAAIPISTTFNQADVDAGMNRIARRGGGAASQYKLRARRSPARSRSTSATPTFRARGSTDSTDPVSKAIVFYGSTSVRRSAIGSALCRSLSYVRRSSVGRIDQPAS